MARTASNDKIGQYLSDHAAEFESVTAEAGSDLHLGKFRMRADHLQLNKHTRGAGAGGCSKGQRPTESRP